VLSASVQLNGPQTLVASANVNVSHNALTTESEMTIAINHANPLNVAGFSHDANNLNQIQVFRSMDGGLTWARTLLNGTGAVNNDGQGSGIRFDPTIRFTENGDLFIAYGAYTGSTTKLMVAKSTDGGATFPNADFRVIDAQPGYGGVDKFYLNTGPAGPDTSTQALYIAYERNAGGQPIMVAGSNDGGDSFTTPFVVDSLGSGSFFAGPGVGPNGELYVVWQSTSDARIKSRAKPDGLWGPGAWHATATVRSLRRAMSQFPIPAQPRRGIYNNPTIDVDRSGGPFTGRAYVGSVDQVSGNNMDVYLSYSDDGGATWSDPGATGNVEDEPGSDFHAWVAVDQSSGSVNVLYYTTDGDPITDKVLARVASSTDGGASFTKVDLSSQRARAASASYTGDFLDYIGLDAYDGTLHALWSDNRGAAPGTFVTDLDAYTAAASFHSATGGNTLIVRGDDAGPSDDTIVLRQSAANPEYLEVVVNGTLQYAGLAASLDAIAVDGGDGDNTVVLQALPPGIAVSITGGGGNNTLVAPDTDNAWQLTGTGAGTLDGTVTFSAVQNLVGGAGADTFVFADGAGVSGGIDGGGGVNAADYSAYSRNVLVDLQTGAATGVGGSLLSIQNVTGGSGGPGGGYNVLVGNGGNILIGGTGRSNLLIAGDGASTLLGGDGQDILIGGTTAYDTDLASLQAIMDYWTGSEDYATRVANLTSGTGVPLLDASTVTGNGAGNTLLGNGGPNLFYGNLDLDETNWDPATETFISV
jgi:hypothetical protein